MLSPLEMHRREVAPLRVVVADDHELMREGIVAVVSRQEGFAVVGCATDAGAAFTLVAQHRPNLLLIDVFLGGHDGTHLVQELATSYPGTRILALCAFEEHTSAQRFLRAGANGFLVKSATSTQLIEAIRTVAQGETYTSRRLRVVPAEAESARAIDNCR